MYLWHLIHPLYLLHTAQRVGAMRSIPPPTPRYGVWDSYLPVLLWDWTRNRSARQILERWCAWRTGSGRASLWSAPLTPCFPNTDCLCNAPGVYFPCKHHLETGDFSAVECLKVSQQFKRSCFPSSPPTSHGEVLPTTAEQTCQSYVHNPGGDGPLLSGMPSSPCCQMSAVHVQPWARAWWKLHAVAPWAAGAQRSEWNWGLAVAFTVLNDTWKEKEQKEDNNLPLSL